MRAAKAAEKRVLDAAFHWPWSAGLAASFTRRRPEALGAGWLGRQLAPRVPHAGRIGATFGADRTVVCDLTSAYDRNLFAGNEEAAERRLLDLLLAPGDEFVDVGANIGLFTVFAGRAVGPGGRVHAFEPVPATCDRLRASVEASHLTDRVRVEQVACSDTSGATVTLSGTRHNEMRIVTRGDAAGVTATTVALDDVLRDTAGIAGMKIDVEGHELAVLRGADATLRRWAPWIIVECNPGITGVAALAEWDVHRHLVALGYAAHRPDEIVEYGLVAPLGDSWAVRRGHVNLVYWTGTAPARLRAAALGPAGTRATRTYRVARDALHRDGAAVVAARLAAPLERTRGAVVRAVRRPPPADLPDAPTGMFAAIAHWRADGPDSAGRVPIFESVLRDLLAGDLPRMTVAVVTNRPDDCAAAIAPLVAAADRVALRRVAVPAEVARASDAEREVVVVPWRPGRLRRHGYYLTWAHVPVLRDAMATERYSHLVYLEDDERFTVEHLRYWCRYREPLAGLGLLPGFVRFEMADGRRCSADLARRVDPSIRHRSTTPAAGRCHEFVNLDLPYQGLFVLDRPLATEFFGSSPWRSPFLTRGHPWNLRERASAGPIFDDVPDGLLSRNVVPVTLTDGRTVLDPACLVEHAAATLTPRRSRPVPIDDLFVPGHCS